MGRIRILPPGLVSKIAAGEVIERPASVVKELVENSLDAGASRIRVELVDGGRRAIRVTDDGEGMTPEDAELALKRHATSKIASEEDLGRILTLGFRGEALAAMAEVSRLILITRAEGYPAVRLVVEGGQLKEKREVGAPRGTQVEVKDIFFNLPARRKFLKASQTELGHATEAVIRMALARPEVDFRVEHEGREILSLQPSSERDRVAAILGRELHPHLAEVDRTDGPLRVKGWVTLPPYARGNTRGIYFYVNRRYIRDKILGKVLGEAYSRLLPRGAYPVAVLFLEVPPEEVDVNIHPTKMEVKFRHTEDVYHLLREALEEVLGSGDVHLPSGMSSPSSQVQESPAPYVPTLPLRPEEGEDRFRPLGQIGQTYLLVEGEKGLLVVDQHAAHERVLYERLKSRRVPAQKLLLPAVVELQGMEAEVLLERRSELAALGFEVEPFGPRSVAVKAIPSLIRVHELKETLEEVASEITGDNGLERARVLLACRGAIKASTPMTPEEIGRLLRELFSTSHPRTCPHGRPTFIEITLEELHRRFKRT
ncbi:MAG TPA: DNA mismatch repair endonuclease MutL [Deltaproteobacteria bacterium]|nr:DNA mismatch repair endonuclease MutL [Deltaproteobacteria bacterium]